MTKKRTGPGNKMNASLPDSEAIKKQTEEFLSKGGHINFISNGVSGFDYQRGSKHITINGGKAGK